ncbi:MAG: adenine phosphoribosyltransferase [bacterium]
MKDELRKYIREVADFPKPGICFYDITTLILDPTGMAKALDRMEEFIRTKSPDLLVGVESRGFVFGAALADRLGLGLALARKAGKLPADTVSASYALEYGSDCIELHQDAVTPGQRVVIVDDLIATGGTLRAVCQMVEKLGGEVVGISSVVELAFLPWHDKLAAYAVDSLVSYGSE